MSQTSETARRHLDKRFSELKSLSLFTRPPKGWIRAIRDALGMSSTQLAKRLKVGQSRIIALEKGEVNGTVTLNKLQEAARALDCRLEYILVPNTSLQQTIESQAKQKAKNMLLKTEHSMRLENQGVERKEMKLQYDRLVKKLGSVDIHSSTN